MTRPPRGELQDVEPRSPLRETLQRSRLIVAQLITDRYLFPDCTIGTPARPLAGLKVGRAERGVGRGSSGAAGTGSLRGPRPRRSFARAKAPNLDLSQISRPVASQLLPTFQTRLPQPLSPALLNPLIICQNLFLNVSIRSRLIRIVTTTPYYSGLGWCPN